MNSDSNGQLDDTHLIGGCRVLYNTTRPTNAKHRKQPVRVQGQGADAVCLSDKVVTCDVDTTCQLGWCLPHPCSTAQPSAARRGDQAHHSQKQPPPFVTVKTRSLTHNTQPCVKCTTRDGHIAPSEHGPAVCSPCLEEQMLPGGCGGHLV